MIAVQDNTFHSLSIYGLVENNNASTIRNGFKNEKNSQNQTTLSNLGKAAAYTGFNVASSSRQLQRDKLQFDFHYSSNQVQNIQASGFHEYKSSKLELRMAFEIQESDLVTDASTNRLFKFEFDLTIENVQFQDANISTYKEDIGSYLLRIAQTISEYAYDKNKEIASLIFDLEDAKELFSLENGKIMKNLMAAINIVRFTNQLLNKDKEKVALYIPRKKETLLHYSSLQSKQIQFNINVTEIINQKESNAPPSYISDEDDLTMENQIAAQEPDPHSINA